MFSLHSSFMNDVSLKPSYWNGSFIHENLWNLRMKQSSSQNYIYSFISLMKCSSTSIHFAYKVIQISWMNIHKISFQVNFQWRNGWSLIDEISWTKFHVWKAEISWNKVHWWNQGCYKGHPKVIWVLSWPFLMSPTALYIFLGKKVGLAQCSSMEV